MLQVSSLRHQTVVVFHQGLNRELECSAQTYARIRVRLSDAMASAAAKHVLLISMSIMMFGHMMQLEQTIVKDLDAQIT